MFVPKPGRRPNLRSSFHHHHLMEAPPHASCRRSLSACTHCRCSGVRSLVSGRYMLQSWAGGLTRLYWLGFWYDKTWTKHWGYKPLLAGTHDCSQARRTRGNNLNWIRIIWKKSESNSDYLEIIRIQFRLFGNNPNPIQIIWK